MLASGKCPPLWDRERFRNVIVPGERAFAVEPAPFTSPNQWWIGVKGRTVLDAYVQILRMRTCTSTTPWRRGLSRVQV